MAVTLFRLILTSPFCNFCHGRRQNFSKGVDGGGGQKHQHRKKLSSFRRAVKQTDNVFCAPVALRNILLFVASAEGASETFRVFRMRAAYDVIFFKFQGEGESTPFVPPPCGAYGCCQTTQSGDQTKASGRLAMCRLIAGMFRKRCPYACSLLLLTNTPLTSLLPGSDSTSIILKRIKSAHLTCKSTT